MKGSRKNSISRRLFNDRDVLFISKAICYRVVGTAVTVLVSFVVTADAVVSLQIGILEVVSKIVAYYGFERVWYWAIEKLRGWKRFSK